MSRLTPIDFLKQVKGWDDKDKGTFDLKGLASILTEYSKDMQHFYDSYKGLYATDRPELLKDENKVLFQL